MLSSENLLKGGPVSPKSGRFSGAFPERWKVWLWNTFLVPSRVNVSPRRGSPVENSNGDGLRPVHRVSKVCNADARDHRRVPKDDWLK